MTTGFEWVALAILLLGITMVIYALVWLHGIPHHIAENNDHPHKSAIHVACWLSVFTLHALWPLVYLWAILPEKRLQVDVNRNDDGLAERIEKLEAQLTQTQSTDSQQQQPLQQQPLQQQGS